MRLAIGVLVSLNSPGLKGEAAEKYNKIDPKLL